jgi:outer membrane protein TolC
LAAQARLDLKRQQLALDEDNLLLLKRQAAQGAVPATMTLEQEGMTATRAHEVQAAESELAQARSALAQQLGLASAAVLRLPEDFSIPSVPGMDEPTLQALATSHRPELRVADASVAQARVELGLQTGALRATDPSLGLAGVREKDGLWMNGLELQISIPIFDTGRARGDLAKAQIAQAEAAAESVRRQVPLEVERALATLAAAQVEASHADHHLHQQLLLEQLAERNYRQGGSDLLRYRQASQARLLSSMDQINARQAVWTALVALQRATGVAATTQ